MPILKKSKPRDLSIRSSKRESVRALFGLGIDLVDVARFTTLDRRKHRAFLGRVFTSTELRYCFGRVNFGQHLAARFAAKEAVKKALHCVGVHRVSERNIEIRNDAHGGPLVRLVAMRQWRVQVSMSHTADFAVAVVFIFSRV